MNHQEAFCVNGLAVSPWLETTGLLFLTTRSYWEQWTYSPLLLASILMTRESISYLLTATTK